MPDTSAVGDSSELMSRIATLEAAVVELKQQVQAASPADRAAIICFSGEWDRLFAALTVASGCLAMGLEVHLFFTFWAADALHCPTPKGPEGDAKGSVTPQTDKDAQQALAQAMSQRLNSAPLSKHNLFGIGKAMMRRLLVKHGIDDIDRLFREVVELGAQLHVCETSTLLFGHKKGASSTDECINHCGVATFLSFAMKSRIVLFV